MRTIRIGSGLLFAVVIGAAALFATPRAEAGSSVYFGYGHYFGDYGHHGYWHHHHRHHGYWRHWHPYPRYHRPPVYDDDIEDWQPAPASPEPSAASPPSAPAPYCREYTTTIVIDGVEQEAYGAACRQEDGSWRLID